MGEAKSKKPNDQSNKGASSISASSVSTKSSSNLKPISEVTYGMKQYKLVFLGIALLVIGFVLMSGGNMPSPDVWDESIIYGFRRIVAAPIFILAGLIVQIWAIFKV